MKIIGIMSIPGSRLTTWQSALFHGFGVRRGGAGNPYRDNASRIPLSITFNRQSLSKVIFPGFLCFPNECVDALKRVADIEFISCDCENEFDRVVSANSVWPRGVDASASAAELLASIPQQDSSLKQCFSELVPARLHLQPESNVRLRKLTFRRRLHIGEVEVKFVNFDYFYSMGILLSEGWFWFVPEVWDIIYNRIDHAFFYSQEAFLD